MRSSSAIATRSSRRCAYRVAPGPRLTASRPWAANSATGVHAVGSSASPPALRSRCTSSESAATWAGGEFDVTWKVGPDEIAEPCLRLRTRAARCVPVVETHLDPVRDHVVGDAAGDARGAEHLDERQPADLDLERHGGDDRPEPLDGEIDRVHALPRPRGVRALALEDERGVEVPQTACVDRVVGGLEHDDEVGVEHERSLAEDARQALPPPGLPPADEEEERDVAPERGPLGGCPASGSTITASPPFMSPAPSPTTQPSSIRPGMLPCAPGTVSRWPASSTSGLLVRSVAKRSASSVA